MKVRERRMETVWFEISAASTTSGLGIAVYTRTLKTRGCAPEIAQGIRESRDHSTQDPSEKGLPEAGVERNEPSVRSQRGWVAKAVAIRRGEVHGSLNEELC
jgi:hypothetical protein